MDDREADLVPVRMLNEYAYCPRLFHLMHVEGRWAENAFTAEGTEAHRRVDRLDHLLQSADELDVPPESDEGDAPPVITRSVPLGSESLGITGKLDLVSAAPGTDGTLEAVPVDTKRGHPPDNPERCWEPERVQLMAQGLLLREAGYRCDHGMLYFAGARRRVTVPFTASLEHRTREVITAARAAQDSPDLPPPLEDDPKCIGCSLSGICLPDETLAMRHPDPATIPPEGLRRLFVPRDDAVPLYVQEPGASVGKTGGQLVVRKHGAELGRARIIDVSQLVVCGAVQVSHAVLHSLCESGVPVVHLSTGHWLYGVTWGMTLRNSFDRAAQFRAAATPRSVLVFARSLVAAKIRNQRTLLLRNAAPRPDRELAELDALAGRAEDARRVKELLGLEGMAARHYFACFGRLLRPDDLDVDWDFRIRNRRPPRDPVNALLSFGYALLAKEVTVAAISEGLDPWWGLYHRPRHGRPSLALDLMEEIRPLVADSAVVTAVNTGMVTRLSFQRTGTACMLNDRGRKAMIRAFESRLDQLVTHPVFGYRCSWRTLLRLQARLFSRWLRGDVPAYQPMMTR